MSPPLPSLPKWGNAAPALTEAVLCSTSGDYMKLGIWANHKKLNGAWCDSSDGVTASDTEVFFLRKCNMNMNNLFTK